MEVKSREAIRNHLDTYATSVDVILRHGLQIVGASKFRAAKNESPAYEHGTVEDTIEFLSEVQTELKEGEELTVETTNSSDDGVETFIVNDIGVFHSPEGEEITEKLHAA